MAASSEAAAERGSRGSAACEPGPDLAARAIREDPYPYYAQLRSLGPVLRARLDGQQTWLVPRYEDCLALLTHPQFRPGGDPADPLLFHDAGGAYVVAGRIAAALKPRAIEALRLHVAEAVISALDRAERRGAFDLVHDYASPIASVGTCELLGVASGDRPLVAAWADELERTTEAREALADYFSEHVRASRRAPALDLLSELILREEADDAELVEFCVALARGGHELGSALLAGGALALLGHRTQARRLRRDPSCVVATVEEAARWSSPIQLTARVARTDVVFRDVAIQAGEQVWAILASANRDGEFFDDPDAFEIDRHSPPHLAFGFGDHLALGTHLARMEAQIGLRLLVRRFPRLRLACESVEPGGSWQVRRPALLPATVGD